LVVKKDDLWPIVSKFDYLHFGQNENPGTEISTENLWQLYNVAQTNPGHFPQVQSEESLQHSYNWAAVSRIPSIARHVGHDGMDT
jgi:hypothetical protein